LQPAWETLMKGVLTRHPSPHGRSVCSGMGEEMTYGHLGRSCLMVSRIGLGTMHLGYTVDEPTSFAVMDAAIDAGMEASGRGAGLRAPR
jgi:hypothetical protein